jgi:hypothetical protein
MNKGHDICEYFWVCVWLNAVTKIKNMAGVIGVVGKNGCCALECNF